MNSIELFAGAGGLGMGLSLAGFSPLEVVEWDADCCATIRENRANGVDPVARWPLTHGDVRAIDFRKYGGKVQLVAGGPPCQPFSIGGRHRAHGDTRDMFPEAIRTLREVKPKAFVFENVKGLTRQTFRNYFEYIRLQMMHPEVAARSGEDWASHLARLERHETRGRIKGLNYRVVAHVANAADYGVPQKRERVFFVGFRSDIDVAWHFPLPTHSGDALAWDQYRSGVYWDRHSVRWQDRALSERLRARAWRSDGRPKASPWQTVRDAIADLPDPEKKSSTQHPSNHKFQPGARSYAGHTGSAMDEPAKTLKAGVHGVPGGENMVLKPDGSVRYFTVRESARLQTFPDAFRFHGSWTESMRQLGNAVPVELARQLGADIARHLAPA